MSSGDLGELGLERAGATWHVAWARWPRLRVFVELLRAWTMVGARCGDRGDGPLGIGKVARGECRSWQHVAQEQGGVSVTRVWRDFL